LSRSSLEQTQVLAGARLPDADGLCGRGNASAALDLDQQTEARRIPEKRERLIGHDDVRYR
jgi:hypothetical protein